MTHARPVFEVLLNALGLGIWAAHFTAIYAANALACERGVGNVPLLVALFTLVALGALALVMRASLRRVGPPLDEGGETEPRFTSWFAAATAGLSALAVIFQALPAFLLPGCA